MSDLYSESAKVLEQTMNKQKNIRNAVYASEFQLGEDSTMNKKQLLRLCCNTLRNRHYLNQLMEVKEVHELLKKPYINQYLLYVLLYDYVFGYGLNNARKLYSDAILERAEYINKRQTRHCYLLKLETMQDAIQKAKIVVKRPSVISETPRYARVNTLKWSVDEALKCNISLFSRQTLQEDGWTISSLKPQNNETWFRDTIISMPKDYVYIDCHVKELLIFCPFVDLHDSWMVTKGYLILQDKASCLPSQVLEPTPGSHVFDICAAPGMKTSHLAALIQNEGKIWAIDQASNRLDTLRTIIQRAGATNVITYCKDFLCVNINDVKYSKVEFALLDPPCSGSGMVKRLDSLVHDEAINGSRLRSLSNLQAMLLKHLSKLPSLKKIVYSTCSIHEEENEGVIDEVLNDPVFKKCFYLVEALPEWRHRGKTSYRFGYKCLRAEPETDLTNGFFVAVFKRRKP
ncbi:unnamed protein product [Thelazia callipaeda]|uniref:SAM_MT_RSMB_NOP domain-containing protein n=1 Tax=Thelazia callipaeda TaxID=103827 RepID=A0A0N5D802_THECL|nr:unnamed protein product [Thelazia callipaeda]